MAGFVHTTQAAPRGRRSLSLLPRAIRPRHLAVLAITIVAVMVRVVLPSAAEFKLDEIRPLSFADRVWSDRDIALTVGVSSTGLSQTPFIGYLLVLPRALGADPRLAVVFLGLLDSLTVLVIYRCLARHGNRRLAIVTAALYAAAPWVVVYSRKTWAEIVPLFSALALWAACEVVLRRRAVWALAFFPLLALQVQCHVVGSLLVVPALATVLLFWPRWRNRYTALGILVGLVVLAPYGWVLARQWPAPLDALRQGGSRGWAPDLRALTYGMWFASGRSVTALMGRSASALAGWERALIVVNATTVTALLGAMACAVHGVLRRRQGWERYALLLIWLWGPILPLILIRGALSMHYALLVSPIVFVFVGLAWARVLAVRRLPALVVGIALAATLLVQTGTVLSIYGGVLRHATEGGFGWPLGYWLGIRRDMGRYAVQGWREVQVLGIDDGPWSSDRAALEHLLGRAYRLRVVGRGGRPGLLVPHQGEMLALTRAVDGDTLQALEQFGRCEAHWPAPGGEGGFALYRLAARDPEELARGAMAPPDATFENGMRLLGVRLDAPPERGRPLPVTTYWTFTGPVHNPAATDTAFHHLLGVDDRRWTQYDGFALGQEHWLAGDTLMQWFTLDLPAELPAADYVLFIGMYSWSDGSRANVVDDAGRFLADGVRIGPISVR